MKNSQLIGVFLACAAGVSACVSPILKIGYLPKETECVAVLPFEVRYEGSGTSEILSEFLALDLYQKGFKGAVGPRDVAQLFLKAKDPLPPEIDPYWAREIGKKLEVAGVIFGSVSQIPVLNPDTPGSSDVNLAIDAYLLDVKSGEMRWMYSSRELVSSEDYSNRMARHSGTMTESLLKLHLPGDSVGRSGCWKAPSVPADVRTTPEPTVAPTPTATPRPPLTNSQKKILADLLERGELVWNAELFEGRGDVLTKEAIVLLRDLATILNEPAAPKTLQIGAHLDGTEDSAVDLALSKLRAEAIKKYLMDVRVPAARLEAVGLGSSQPKFPNINERSRRMNRRVEFKPKGDRSE